jgi:hypothetical protein
MGSWSLEGANLETNPPPSTFCLSPLSFYLFNSTITMNSINSINSPIRHPVFRSKHLPYALCPLPYAHSPQPATFIQHPASSIEYPASNIEYPASNIEYPASSIEYPASNIELTHLGVSRFIFQTSIAPSKSLYFVFTCDNFSCISVFWESHSSGHS